MSIVKVIEVIASSEKSIEDALQQAVAEASKTVRNIDSVYVKDIKAHVADGKISSYGLICKISFRLDEEEATASDNTKAEQEKSPVQQQAQKQENGEEPQQKKEKQEADETAHKEHEAPPLVGKSPIQGAPGKETERGEGKPSSNKKEGENKPQPAASKDQTQKKPDDRVEGEEEVSEPENQKDFIPAH